MRDEYRRHIGRPVMVEIDGNTVGGTMVRADKLSVTLEAANLLGRAAATPIDGLIVLARARITWVQVAV